jgi:hypothetical protein
MELKSQEIIEVLKKLIGGEDVETPLGKGLSIDAREAFLFCAIAGGSYFENQIFPFTPKGLLKVFYNANDFNLVTGIFDNSILKNTPHYIAEQRTYIKDYGKVIVPIDIDSEASLRLKIKDVYGLDGFDPNLVLFRIDLSKKGFGLEPFMEYLSCKYFTNLGYITENQIPLSHKLGSPDFGGYALEKIQTLITVSGLLPRGFNVLELAMLRTFPALESVSVANTKSQTHLIVGEAKTSTTVMDVQLKKYLSSGFFNLGIEIHPNKVRASNPNFGLLRLQEFNLVYEEPLTFETNDILDQQEYKKWLEAYFNSYLLANYTNDELNLVAKKLMGKKIDTKVDLISLIRDFSFEHQFKILIGFLKDGAI